MCSGLLSKTRPKVPTLEKLSVLESSLCPEWCGAGAHSPLNCVKPVGPDPVEKYEKRILPCKAQNYQFISGSDRLSLENSQQHVTLCHLGNFRSYYIPRTLCADPGFPGGSCQGVDSCISAPAQGASGVSTSVALLEVRALNEEGSGALSPSCMEAGRCCSDHHH